MSPVYVFEEMRLPMELLAAALAFLLPFGARKPHFWLRAVLGYVGAVLFSLLFFPIFLNKEAPRFENFSVFWYTLIALSAMVYGKLCFQIGWCDALFFDISAFLTQNIAYCVYHCFFARVLFERIREWLPLYVLGAVLVTAVVLISVYFIFRKPLRMCNGKLMDNSRYILYGLIGMFMAMIVCLFFYQGAFEFRISIFDRMAWISGIVLCVFFLLTQYSVISAIIRTRETTALENMLRGSEHHYELTKEHITIINRKCHDLKHQLKALELATDDERTEYIREARNSVIFYQHLVYTDNEALNTILAEKGLFCQERDIDFRCAVDDVDLSFIRLPDLYALLGNAIDNAIEYAGSQKDPAMRIINLRIDQKDLFVGIQVTNPYSGHILSPDELPKTNKPNPQDHGFGLRSMRYLAEKYGGAMEYSTIENQFTLQILLPISKQLTDMQL